MTLEKKAYLKSASLKNCSEHDIGTKKVIFITQRAYRFLCIAINARTIQRAIIYQQCKRLKKKIVPPGRAKLSPFFFTILRQKSNFQISKRSSPVRWGNVLQGSSPVRW